MVVLRFSEHLIKTHSGHPTGLTRESTMKLKLGEYASIAEIIGAFAVVISLLYVGVQVNDSECGQGSIGQ